MSIGNTLKQFRKTAKLTQEELARKANLSRSYVADIERDRYNPSVETLKVIAGALHIGAAQLIGEEKPGYTVTDKDEGDIARDLEHAMAKLDSNQTITFYGEQLDLDEEERELLRASMEQTFRLAKQLAKKKFRN